MIKVVLQEHDTSETLPINKSDIPIIKERLGNLADVIFDIDGIKIKARSYVGFIPINEEIQLIVTPKIKSFDDFFYVLEKAGLTPEYRQWIDDGVFAEFDESKKENPTEFLIRLLVEKLRYIKRDGFYRKSLSKSEIRSSVKGRIDITNTLRQSVLRGKLYKVNCTYFDPTIDTIENRFIKYAIWWLIHTNLPRDIKRQLREYWRIFSSIPFVISEQYLSEINLIISRRQVPGSRSYYLEILSLCYLIINNSTVVIKEGERLRLSAFTIDMNLMFEKYVRNVLVESLESEFSVIDGEQEDKKLFYNSDRPRITPDILINHSDACILVADAKYKEKSQPNIEDWYQVISYALALDIPIGILIYGSERRRNPKEFKLADKSMWVYYYSLKDPADQEENYVNFFRERIERAL